LMRRTSFTLAGGRSDLLPLGFTQDVPFSYASYWVRSDRGAFISVFVS
jgi:hypothetical protein